MSDSNQLLELAAFICITRHVGQTDKAGEPYFQHPMRVATHCETKEQKIVALLHDIIEDTPMTSADLLNQGFPVEVVNAVLSVTRQKNEEYEDFIKRVGTNNIGRYVKLRDLEDNLNPFRMSSFEEKDMARINKYLKAHKYLSELCD